VTSDLHFRFMTSGDVPEVMAIENDVHLAPWTEGIFQDCIRVAYHCEVAEQDGKVLGYIVLSVSAGEAHLFNVCVRRDQQGKGLGRALVARAVEVARIREADSMFLEVRPSNKVALALYDSMGFNEVGVRKNYYPAKNGREDALILALPLPPQ